MIRHIADASAMMPLRELLMRFSFRLHITHLRLLFDYLRHAAFDAALVADASLRCHD